MIEQEGRRPGGAWSRSSSKAGALGKPNPCPARPGRARDATPAGPRGLRQRFADRADRYRDKLIELYGAEQGKKVRYAEAFEICEYGRQPTSDEIRQLFPFFPRRNDTHSADRGPFILNFHL